jgi:hypothetical protein
VTRRAAPGPQLSAGRLRVDAARAIAKLREYQLAVRAAWVLEAIRAAVAAGATRISLTGDTNDLWLAWDGEPWPAADLPRLFDELVSPEASDARYHVRLLAAAVNSALGMNPAFIDVFAVAAAGHARRARYTPDVLDEPEGELADAPLRRIAVEVAPPPPGAGTGMAIHLRRRFGMAVLSHLVRELPEIELARAACADLGVPLFVRGTEHGRGAAARDVVRVPLGDGLRGFIAIVDPTDAGTGPTIEMAEHGVVLAKHQLDLGFPDPDRAPVRMFVDAPRMPTNASRSEVRTDVHPISTALHRARALFPALTEQLAAELDGPRAPRARAAALRLLAAAGHARAPLLGLGRLLELPLVRNAVGAPRPAAAVWQGPVYTGGSPLPEELAPWLADVLWVPPGDPSECLYDPDKVDALAAKRLVRWARRERRAQRRFYGHASRPPVVEARELPRMRARLGATVPGSLVEPRGFEGLTGEVCILPRGKGGELVLLLEGRELERVTFGSPIPFQAVIDSPRFVPADRYRGAAREAEYERALAAMRAGVLCAVEAIAASAAGGAGAGDADDVGSGDGGAGHASRGDGAASGAGSGDGGATIDARAGFVPGESDPDPDADHRRILDGLALAQELAQGSAGVRATGPLFAAPLWRLCGTGDWVSTAELRRHTVVGMIDPGARIRALSHRPIIEVEERDQPLFTELLPRRTRIVTYDADLVEPEPLYSIDLAQGLVEEADLALAVRGEGCAAAIAPAIAPRVVISHLGRRVEERAYDPALIPCTIHVDSDDVVPDAQWLTALDDGGVARHFAGWEQELLRAAAAALTGTRVDDLLGHAPVDAGGLLGRALWAALAGRDRDPDQLLGAELAAKLRAQPLWRVLGERDLVSATDLAARFPVELPYLDAGPELAPIAGFAPLIADEARAHAAGRLAGRAVRSAAPELAEHRRRAEREARLAALRMLPVLPLELPDGAISVRRETPQLRAVIGVGRGAGMELAIRAEGRTIAARVLPGELPIAAIADVPLKSLDDALAGPTPVAESAIVRSLRGAIPPLLVELAKAQPEALADLGPARTLLAAALSVLYIDPATRTALLTAQAFPTIQGPRASIGQAARDGVLATARWDGEWLGPDDGEAPTDLDRPVLHVEDAELRRVIERLSRQTLADLSEAADKLQARRRVARGLLPLPVVHGVAPELKRRLDELERAVAPAESGPAPASLGPGEIGFVDEPSALALLHVRGEVRDHVTLNVLPPVRIAIEAPELVGDRSRAAFALQGQVQALTLALIRAVLAGLPAPPVWLRSRLRHALLSGRGTAELEGMPLFETAAGTWIDRAALAQQVELFGDVWSISRFVPDSRPLDERRLVLVLGDGEQSLARWAGIPCVDAARDLALDAKARANLARPRPAQLAIDPAIETLAKVTLDGDGRTAPRGVVAVLTGPHAERHRGIHAHRELYPFDPAADDCLWPTLAVVDDARISPDRTWSLPGRDAAWEELVAAVRNASEAALRELVRPPPRALASLVVGFSHHTDLAALRGDGKTQLRGALWLDGAPGDPGRVDVIHTQGSSPYTPPRGVPMRGTLYLSTWFHSPRIQEALDELCTTVHARMLRKLAARENPSDLALAHVAHGIAHGTITPSDARSLQLRCFRPRPLDAREWEQLCWSQQRVPRVAADAAVEELSVVDDGSATARVVLEVLGERTRREVPAPLSTAPPERVADVLRDLLPPLPPVPPVRPAHELQPLVAAIGARLHQLGLAQPLFTLNDYIASPLAAYDNGTVTLAAGSPQLRAIAAALLAKTAWSEAAVDALTAHVVTVLNVALTSVTDTTEAHALAGLLQHT